MNIHLFQSSIRTLSLIVALVWLTACGSGPALPTPVPTLSAEGVTIIRVGEGGETATEVQEEAEPAGETATAAETESDASVRFIEPTNDATVTNPVHVTIGVDGLTVEPSGEIHEGAGHLHILVDTGFIEPGTVIPSDDAHLHLGDGSLERELTLTPGEHVLRLQFADGAHTALDGEQYHAEITVTVSE